jgi:hypothetical protein
LSGIADVDCGFSLLVSYIGLCLVEEGFERCLWFDAYGLGKVAASAKASLYEVLFHAIIGCHLDGLFVESFEVASERFVFFLDYSF